MQDSLKLAVREVETKRGKKSDTEYDIKEQSALMQDSLKLAVREVEAKRGKKSVEEVSENLTKPKIKT
jgi:hypothetical protein